MRLRVIHFFLSVPASGLGIASAETIHFNNGRIIVGDRVQENHNRYEYEIGEETYAIPRSSVDLVDRGGLPTPFAWRGKSWRSADLCTCRYAGQ